MSTSDELPEVEAGYTGGWGDAQTGRRAGYSAFTGSGGSANAEGRHRSYGWTYGPVPDVFTPQGNRNTGYVTSTTPGYQQWRRGSLPDAMPSETGFGLPRPRFMREPGNTWGTYPSMKD